MISIFWKKRISRWIGVNKKAYPYEYFNNIDDFQKPINDLKEEEFVSILKNTCPTDEKIERAKAIIKLINTINGEELIKVDFKGDVSY